MNQSVADRGGAHSAELDLLRRWLREDFPRHSSILFRICTDHSDGRVLYLTHVDVANGSAYGRELPRETLFFIKRFYVYLVASYYTIDAIADNHLSTEIGSSAFTLLPALLAKATSGFVRIADPYGVSNQADTLIAQALVDNSDALAMERNCRTSEKPFEWAREFSHMSGRSNAFVFLLKYVSLLKGEELSKEFLGFVDEFLFIVQRGDDLCDWREDFLRKNWTPFLRSVFGTRLSVLDVCDVESVVYLDGVMESELQEIMGQLESLYRRLENHARYSALREMVHVHGNRVRKKHDIFVSQKVACG